MPWTKTTDSPSSGPLASRCVLSREVSTTSEVIPSHQVRFRHLRPLLVAEPSALKSTPRTGILEPAGACVKAAPAGLLRQRREHFVVIYQLLERHPVEP